MLHSVCLPLSLMGLCVFAIANDIFDFNHELSDEVFTSLVFTIQPFIHWWFDKWRSTRTILTLLLIWVIYRIRLKAALKTGYETENFQCDLSIRHNLGLKLQKSGRTLYKTLQRWRQHFRVSQTSNILYGELRHRTKMRFSPKSYAESETKKIHNKKLSKFHKNQLIDSLDMGFSDTATLVYGRITRGPHGML